MLRRPLGARVGCGWWQADQVGGESSGESISPLVVTPGDSHARIGNSSEPGGRMRGRSVGDCMVGVVGLQPPHRRIQLVFSILSFSSTDCMTMICPFPQARVVESFSPSTEFLT